MLRHAHISKVGSIFILTTDGEKQGFNSLTDALKWCRDNMVEVKAIKLGGHYAEDERE